MATLPRKQCTHPGCCEIVTAGRCPKHEHRKQQEYYENRNKDYQHLYNYRWQKYSKARLKAHPLCEECLRQGKTTRATETDHIEAHLGSRHKFFIRANHQSLCKSCHSKKTINEGSFGKWNDIIIKDMIIIQGLNVQWYQLHRVGRFFFVEI